MAVGKGTLLCRDWEVWKVISEKKIALTLKIGKIGRFLGKIRHLKRDKV